MRPVAKSRIISQKIYGLVDSLHDKPCGTGIVFGNVVGFWSRFCSALASHLTCIYSPLRKGLLTRFRWQIRRHRLL